MPSTTLTGHIIALAPRAERFARWELLCPEQGFVGLTVPVKIATPFGLFDKVEVLASLRGKGHFASELHLISRPSALAQNYAALTEASRLAQLTRAAFHHMPDYAPVAAIFEKSLEHYTSPARPEVVTLKAFFKMLEAEGFPARQDWLENIPATLRAEATTALFADLASPLPPLSEPILPSLIAWAQRELGFRTG